jgi:peptidoglycan/LPS O-acetylase OafA/YrhL
VLALAVYMTFQTALLDTPPTWDVSKWYFWRTGVFVALAAGVAFWGFRNVLGRRRVLPSGLLGD